MRVHEVRDRNLRGGASIFARSMKWAGDTTGVLGGNARAIRPGSPQEIAVITAYNERLGQLGCAKYDIASELSSANAQNWKIR